MASPESKKKVAALIVSGMPSPGKLKGKPMGGMDEDDVEDKGDGGDDEDAEGQSAAEASAFGDIRQAFASKDDEAGASALKEFLSLCGYSKSE